MNNLIIEKIYPYSDYNIVKFINKNKDIFLKYNEEDVSEFLKEIVLFNSEYIIKSLIKIPYIYQIKIKHEEEEYYFLHFLFLFSDKINNGLLENYLIINITNDENFIDFHIEKNIDILHLLIKKNISPNLIILNKWLSKNKINKTIHDTKYGSLISEYKKNYIYEVIYNHRFYFNDRIFGDSFEQKEFFFSMSNHLFSNTIDKYNIEDVFLLLKFFDEKYLLINELKILKFFFEEGIIMNKKQNIFPQKEIKLSDFEMFLLIKNIWFKIIGSPDKKERDIKYSLNILKILNNIDDINRCINSIKEESNSLEEIKFSNKNNEYIKKRL